VAAFLLSLFRLCIFHVLSDIFYIFLLLSTVGFLLFYNYLMKDTKLLKIWLQVQFALKNQQQHPVNIQTVRMLLLLKDICVAGGFCSNVFFFFFLNTTQGGTC